MRILLAALIGVVLSVPFMVGCDKNERRIERREKIEVRGEPTPIVVPD